MLSDFFFTGCETVKLQKVETILSNTKTFDTDIIIAKDHFYRQHPCPPAPVAWLPSTFW